MSVSTIAAIQTDPNGALLVEELELPDPRPDQVRVKLLSGCLYLPTFQTTLLIQLVMLPLRATQKYQAH